MKLKNDAFRKSRGGYSRLLKITCSSCDEPLFYYQKDGPGIIKRLYVDRMYETIKGTRLRCKNCNTLLGNLTMYKREHRPAFAILSGTIKKEIVKLSKDL